MPELIPAEPGSPEWLAARVAGVTATDIVTILGLSSWDSAYSLFWRKMGQVPETPDNDRFRLGRELEPYVAERWGETQPPGAVIRPGGLFRHSERSWQLATLDYDLPDYTPVECKTWADADRHSWDGGLPARVRAQVLWQMDVMDAESGHVGVVFLPGGAFRSYVIEIGCWNSDFGGRTCPADEMACAEHLDIDLMRTAGEEFMGRLRLELPPPDPDSSAATLAAVRARFTPQPGKQAEVDNSTYVEWLATKRAADAMAEDARELEIKLREQAGEAAVLCVDGEPVARRVIVDAQVKAHKRHQDYLRRVTQQGNDDE